MKQYIQELRLFILLIMALLVLTACTIGGTAPSTTETEKSPATQTSPHQLSTAVGPVSPAEMTRQVSFGDPVALAYNPVHGGLLKADSKGLARWQAGGNWENMAVPGATSLTGVVVNPTAPDNIYIAGPGLGVSRSDDGAASWQQINAGLTSLEVTALAMHSFRRETLYVWINSQGIYRTEDGGATWKKVPDVPIADPNVRGLTHSTLPGSMNTGWLYAATPSGAYLSMD